MDIRNKDVMIYRYDPRRKYFLVSLHLENRPGALGNLANLLAIRGINILEGFFGDLGGSNGTVGFILESTNQRMDEDWLKDFLKTSVYVDDVEVKGGTDGFLADSLNFPVTWNNGQRAVVIRAEGLRAMLGTAMDASRDGGETIYKSAYSYGRWAFLDLLGEFHPRSKEAVAELLHVLTAAGWGKTEVIEFDQKRRAARVRVKECFECSGDSGGGPTCHFYRGLLSGAMSVIFGEEVEAKESKCASAGDPHCEFEVPPRTSSAP